MSLSSNDLSQFTGTANYYKSIVPSIRYTDGVKYLADKGGAHWLIDKISTIQLEPAVGNEPFQVWRLSRDPEGYGAALVCEDGNEKVVYKEKIDFTDFPLPSVTLYQTDGVILLPSEY